MTILEFQAMFPTEESCKLDFRLKREQEGVVCKKCASQNHYWLSNKWQWQCVSCRFRTTLRSGTFMQFSHLSFLIWYQTIALMTFSKKGVSSLEIQRQLGHSRYESVFTMVHKIRRAMGKINFHETLKGMVEFDEGYYEVSTPDKIRLKRGRGSKKQVKVAISVESVPLENIRKGTVSNWCGRFKMDVLEGHQGELVEEYLAKSIEKNSVLFTDKSTSYQGLSKNFDHHPKLSKEHIKGKTLRWSHIAISNSKRKLLGINHKINKEYLQNYLDEFCFKLNRRYKHGNMFFFALNALILNYW
jgi:hypothetical protein